MGSARFKSFQQLTNVAKHTDYKILDKFLNLCGITFHIYKMEIE